MSLRCDESTGVAKPDGSNKTERRGLRFPFSLCEPGYLDWHPLPISPPRPEGEELLPKRRMRMGAPPEARKNLGFIITPKSKELYKNLSSSIDMSLRHDESTAVTKPDGSNKTERRGLRFPFSPCEPGYLDRHPLPIPPPRPEGEELLPKRRMRMGAPPEARKNLGFIITPKSKELYKNLSSSIDMSLCHDESTVVTKPDGSKTFPYGRLCFPFRACEPGYLDRHHPLPIPLPCPDSIGEELLPKRRMHLGDSPDGPEGGCRICSLDEHRSTLCPYNKSHIPKNAIVGRGCDVVCKVWRTLVRGVPSYNIQ